MQYEIARSFNLSVTQTEPATTPANVPGRDPVRRNKTMSSKKRRAKRSRARARARMTQLRAIRKESRQAPYFVVEPRSTRHLRAPERKSRFVALVHGLEAGRRRSSANEALDAQRKLSKKVKRSRREALRRAKANNPANPKFGWRVRQAGKKSSGKTPTCIVTSWEIFSGLFLAELVKKAVGLGCLQDYLQAEALRAQGKASKAARREKYWAKREAQEAQARREARIRRGRDERSIKIRKLSSNLGLRLLEAEKVYDLRKAQAEKARRMRQEEREYALSRGLAQQEARKRAKASLECSLHEYWRKEQKNYGIRIVGVPAAKVAA